MNLRAYLDTLPRGGIADFARRIGKSPVYLSQLAAGQDAREPSPALAVTISRESGGLVRLHELRRDWASIWPSPEVTAAAEVQ